MTDTDSIVRRLCARPDDRAVSFTVGYVLTVAIAVVLVSGLVVSVGQVVRDERTETIRGEATIVGDQTAAAVMEADRLARRGQGANVTVELDLPARLAGEPYRISLRADEDGGSVIVRTTGPAVAVSTSLTNRTGIENATVTGGDVRVVLRSDGRLTVRGGDP